MHNEDLAKARKQTIVDRLSGKKSKEEVVYRPAEKGSKKDCSECRFFLKAGNPTSNCERVAGLVYDRDICNLFIPREEEGQGDQGLSVTVSVTA